MFRPRNHVNGRLHTGPAGACVRARHDTISLSGQAEIEAGDGTVARIEPGDVVLAEDLTGQGHITRVVGAEPRFYALVPLAER